MPNENPANPTAPTVGLNLDIINETDDTVLTAATGPTNIGTRPSPIVLF